MTARLLSFALFLVMSSTALARSHFVLFDGGKEPFSADQFGYACRRTDAGENVVVTVRMSAKAARAFRRARVWLYSGDTLILDADLAASNLKDGGKELTLTVAKSHLEKGQVVIYSSAIEGAPAVDDFAGFKFPLKGQMEADLPGESE